LEQYRFADRHIGPDAEQQATMLDTRGYDTLDDLTAAAVPPAIRTGTELDLPAALSEAEALAALRALADRNEVFTSLIGMVPGTVT
jgi:glycine dehydrogenase